MDEVLKAAGGNSLRGLRGMLRKPGKTATLAEIEAGIVRGARVMIGIDICRMATATFDRKAAKAAGFVAIK